MQHTCNCVKVFIWENATWLGRPSIYQSECWCWRYIWYIDMPKHAEETLDMMRCDLGMFRVIEKEKARCKRADKN